METVVFEADGVVKVEIVKKVVELPLRLEVVRLLAVDPEAADVVGGNTEMVVEFPRLLTKLVVVDIED